MKTYLQINEMRICALFALTVVFTFIILNPLAAQVKDYSTDQNLTPEVKQFLKGLNNGGPGLETMSPENARLALVNAQNVANVDMFGVELSEKNIRVDGHDIKLDIVRPAGNKGILPVFIFIHGGGWILGDFPTHKRMVRDLVVLSGCVGVFVNYTRTPEAKYPVALNEIYAATKWVATNGRQIQVDGTRLAVVGNSVGGNMTAVTSLKAKLENGPKIAVQIMMWPIVDANFSTESYRSFGEDRFLTTKLMKWMYDFYIPDLEKRKDIYASPLHATIEQLRDLPPTLIQVAENDVLRDEGEAFGRKLESAGVKAVTVRYNGVIHDFGLLNGLADIPQTKSLFLQAAAELKKYLKP